MITLDVEGYNLLNQEVWLPNTGVLKEYSVPAIVRAPETGLEIHTTPF